MKKYLAYYIFLTALVFAAVFHTVFVGSVFVSHGSRVSSLEAEKFQLKQETQHLERQVTSTVALQQLESEAEKQGFRSISAPLALVDSGSEVALR